MITLKQIAARANVSEATVSRALRNDKSISEATRRRIQELAKEMGHTGNRLARGLALKRTHTVGLVVPKTPNAWFRELSWSIAECFHSHGYVCIAPMLDRPEAVRYLAESMVEAIVIWGGRMIDQASAEERRFYETVFRSIPTVCIASNLTEAGIPAVDVDRRAVVKEIVGRLAALGHRRIVFASDTAAKGTTEQKVKGYVEAMQALGLEPRLVHCPGNHLAAYERTEAILAEEPTAVIAGRCEIALGFASGCMYHGVRIPEDLSIVGYDNTAYVEGFVPRITTVGPDAREMAETVARLLLARLEQKGSPPVEASVVWVPHHWKDRGSIAPPRA